MDNNPYLMAAMGAALIGVGYFYWFRIRPNYHRRNERWLALFWYGIAWMPPHKNKHQWWVMRYGGIGLVSAEMGLLMIWISVVNSLKIEHTIKNVLVIVPLVFIFLSILVFAIYVAVKRFDDTKAPAGSGPPHFHVNRRDYLAGLRGQVSMLEDCLQAGEVELAGKAGALTASYPVPHPPLDYLMEAKDKDWVGGNGDGSDFQYWMKMQQSAASLHRKYARYYTIISLAPILLFGSAMLYLIVIGFPIVFGLAFLLMLILLDYLNFTYALFHYRSYKLCFLKCALCKALERRLVSLHPVCLTSGR